MVGGGHRLYRPTLELALRLLPIDCDFLICLIGFVISGILFQIRSSPITLVFFYNVTFLRLRGYLHTYEVGNFIMKLEKTASGAA